jgi:hypothetical protein
MRASGVFTGTTNSPSRLPRQSLYHSMAMRFTGGRRFAPRLRFWPMTDRNSPALRLLNRSKPQVSQRPFATLQRRPPYGASATGSNAPDLLLILVADPFTGPFGSLLLSSRPFGGRRENQRSNPLPVPKSVSLAGRTESTPHRGLSSPTDQCAQQLAGSRGLPE